MTAEEYINNPLLRYPLLLYGCYTVEKTSKGTVLERSKRMLENNQTLFIFPTGCLEKDQNLNYCVKTGVIRLQRDVDNCFIVPSGISIINNINSKNLLLRNIKTKIVIQEAIRHNHFPHDLQPLADELYNGIKNGL